MSGTGARRAPSAVVVVAVLAAIVVGLGVSVAVVAGIAGGVRAAAESVAGSATPLPTHGPTVTESMQILTEDVQAERHIVTSYGAGFGPMYTNASWSVQAGDTVVLRIRSYDDGSAPLMGAQTMFDRVEGTVGGVETVDGKTVRQVANDDVAHTFTVVGLGLNLPIPAAPTGGYVTVVARFVPHKTGVFTWQCYAPCGSGPNLMGGPMAVEGWMEGKVQVVR
ncbi:MAG TPA: hypothetical protein VFN50_02640 [Acidimicrobiales bacterium]|nr:hypothetical protein [Acidimicrobiales bacterium]